MISKFITTYKRLLQAIDYLHHRYVYNEFSTNSRLTGLIGPRGTGKISVVTLKDILENRDKLEEKIAGIKKIKGYFNEYLNIRE